MATEPRNAEQAPEVRMITYPFPMRQDLLAELRLPVDLTITEAEKIGRFVISLAIYPEKRDD